VGVTLQQTRSHENSSCSLKVDNSRGARLKWRIIPSDTNIRSLPDSYVTEQMKCVQCFEPNDVRWRLCTVNWDGWDRRDSGRFQDAIATFDYGNLLKSLRITGAMSKIQTRNLHNKIRITDNVTCSINMR
jgi:hypothetical protein